MQSVLYNSCDSDDFKKSSEIIDPGLYYTSTYYEEEPIYSDIKKPPDETAPNEKTTIDSVVSPIKIQENLVTHVDLPPILWHGFDVVPKILNVSNTGQTILINGQWPNGRPYIEGGPFNGTYIFSQIHFHSPSEHEVAGRRYPLEMHVVHYKTSYLTQERAMHEKDGTVVLVYLFEVLDSCPSALSSVTKLTHHIEKVNSKTETKDVALDQIVQPFTSNYYVYWGSVSTKRNSYLLQWVINGCILFVTSQEAENLLNVMNFEDVTSENIPRMKPQNDRVFYVKEIANEEKELVVGKVLREDAEVQASKEINEVEKCDTGIQSDRAFWPLKSCYKCGSNIVCELAKDKNSAAMELLIGEEDDMCGPKSSCKLIKSFSGLRGTLCCHKKKEKEKSIKSWSNSCVTPSDLAIAEPCDLTDKKISKKDVKIVPVGLQEIPSCQSLSSDTESPPLSNEEVPVKSVEPVEPVENKDESCKLTIEADCPSMKKICERKRKGKKKKSAESCKVQVTVSSSGSECPAKEREKRKRKPRSDPKKTSSGRRIKKTERPKKPKKKVKEKNSCEREPTSSNRSESSKESVGETRKKQKNRTKYEVELPVECRVATVDNDNFDAALTDYSVINLDDVKSLIMEDKPTVESFPDSKCKEMFAALKSSFHSDCSSGFTTLFEKKRNIKAPELSDDNCAINVLLPPTNISKNTSSFVFNQKTESEEVKHFPSSVRKEYPDLSNFTVEKITCSKVEEPEKSSTDSKKEFCVHVDLLFRSKNEDVSECQAQEYNLTLIYNQNILQEYKGVLHPSALELGSYEKLDLLPKYPELDNINVELQDCTVKMESKDEISMKAKFLLKEISLKGDDASPEFTGTSDRKIVTGIDAETQYSNNEIDKPKDDVLMDVQKFEQNENLPENKHKNKISFIECERSISKTNLNIAMHDNQISNHKKSHSQLNLENVNLECKVKSMPNADAYPGESNKNTVLNSVEQSTDTNKEERRDKNQTKESDKELRDSNPNKKKTVYFMYEKIEKDQNSGKKIFIGSFRSKDDLKHLSKEKKLISNEPDHNSGGNEEKLLLLPNNDTAEELSVDGSTEKELKIISPMPSKNLLNKKNMVTLQKYRSKHLGVNSSKKERMNLVVGKVMKLQNESKGIKRLANLGGNDKRRSPKISIYELEKPSENENFPSTSASTRISDFSNQSLSTNSELKLDKKRKSKKSVPGCAKAGCNEEFSKHLSKSAVIVIPVEVESLSKIEVILVEHNDSFKRSTQKPEREIIPCLNYGE